MIKKRSFRRSDSDKRSLLSVSCSGVRLEAFPLASEPAFQTETGFNLNHKSLGPNDSAVCHRISEASDILRARREGNEDVLSFLSGPGNCTIVTCEGRDA